MSAAAIHKGRGSPVNPANRFENRALERDLDWNPADDARPRTEVLKDTTQSFITYNNSPDLGFGASINPYRGCEHGCAYCFARPYHEYLGFSSGLDFETKIVIKENAPELLRRELASPKWRPQVLAMSGVTDCYQPLERTYQLTRRCLEVLAEFRNPVGIVTKNFLVTRDIDLLAELARHQAVIVHLSITSLDSELTRRLEPRASMPAARLEAVRLLTAAGIPVVVMTAPMIPGLNDHEMPAILAAAAQAGAVDAAFTPIRLPHAVKEIFEKWLEAHFPEQKEKILGRIRSLRGGQLNDPNFNSRMTGQGLFAEHLAQLFRVSCRKAGLPKPHPPLTTAHFRRPPGPQFELALGL